jgi:hypothetical protein
VRPNRVGVSSWRTQLENESTQFVFFYHLEIGFFVRFIGPDNFVLKERNHLTVVLFHELILVGSVVFEFTMDNFVAHGIIVAYRVKI